jgi:hypothetical protein
MTWVQHPSYSRVSPATMVPSNIVAQSPTSFQPSQYCEVFPDHSAEMPQLAGIPAQAYISNVQNSRQQFYNGQSNRPFRYFSFNS